MSRRVRYAVVGIGHIAQVAVLPAFEHARRSSELVALITGDVKKTAQVARKYGSPAPAVVPYEDYEEFLDSGAVDAVYIAVPNHRHTEFAVPALKRGIHVLCEKPLTIKSQDAQKLIAMSETHGALLMTAYRLHFEAANLDVIARIHQKKSLGELRYFSSVFSYQVEDPSNIRLKHKAGGGPIWDIGIYCINAARAIFRDEPTEVFALESRRPADKRFREVPESVAVVLKFPDERLASFVCSFGAAEAGAYDVVGTKGSIRLENAYEYTEARTRTIKRERVKRTEKKSYRQHDQFGPEIDYFSKCIQTGETPEPSGKEGLIDVRIIEAILESARTGSKVVLNPGRTSKLRRVRRPEPSQRRTWAAIKKPNEVGVRSPH